MRAKNHTPRKEMVLLYRPEQADAQEKLPQLRKIWGEYRLVAQEELSMWTGGLQAICHTPEQAEGKIIPAAGGDGDGRTQFQEARSAFKGCGGAGISLPIKMVITHCEALGVWAADSGGFLGSTLCF